MNVLERQITYGPFLERLRSAPARVLLLDYDGTLAPFCVDRTLAFPYPEVPPLIVRIMAQGTRVVLDQRAPGAGNTFAQRNLVPSRKYGEATAWSGSRPTAAMKSVRCRPTRIICWRPKPCCAMPDWRARPKSSRAESQCTGEVWIRPRAEKMAREVPRLWRPLLERAPLRLLEFDGGLEIRVAGPGKGDAVRAILRESGPGAAVAYLGDDQTDEDAFHALKGNGLTALVRPQSRPTAADIWLQPPHELLQFLEEWLRASGGQG